MNDIKELLGKRIREIRKSYNLTQEQLAELVGIETPSISNIEKGKYYPASENLEKIAEALKVKIYELYMYEHLKPVDELKKELIQALDVDENLTRLVYKFYQAVK